MTTERLTIEQKLIMNKALTEGKVMTDTVTKYVLQRWTPAMKCWIDLFTTFDKDRAMVEYTSLNNVGGFHYRVLQRGDVVIATSEDKDVHTAASPPNNDAIRR